MSPVLASILIAVLVLLPGYALLPGSYPKRLRLPFVVFASVGVTSVAALILMAAGRFSVPLLAVVEVPLLLLRLRSGRWPGLDPRSHLPVIAIVAGVVVFAVGTSGEPFDATGDAGVYTISALHLSETGRWTWPIGEVIPDGVSQDLVVYEPSYVRPWREVAPGFLVRGDLVVPQFFPLYAIWGAIFAAWLGIHGVLAANVLGAVMVVLGCDALLRLLVGGAWRFAGLAAVVLNPVFLVFLKYPSAEMFLAGLLAGWLFWMVLFLRRPARSSVVMPATLLALAILTKFFAWAVAGAVVLVLVLLPVRHIKTSVTFLLLLLPAFVIDVVLAGPHLENHLGQLLILSGFKLILVGCGAVLLLRLVWSRVARVAPPLLAALYCAALVFLWLTSAGNHVRDYAALSGRLIVWGAAAGLLAYVWRRRAVWLVFPAFVFILLSLYLFFGSGDSPYYPFAARRYLPLTVPLGALFVAYLARSSARWFGRLLPPVRLASSVVVTVLLAVAVLPSLWTQRSAVLVSQGDGFLDTLARLGKAIPEGRMVLATGPAWRYSPHFLLRGAPVFCLDPRRPDALGRIKGLFELDSELLVLSAEARGSGLLEVIEERRQFIERTTSPPLKAATPRGADFHLFVIDPNGVSAPGLLDIGADDQLRLAGFYRAERADGRDFRWAGPHAKILVGPAQHFRFVWSPGSNPIQPLSIRVFARGRQIGEAHLDRGWQTSSWFDIPGGDGPVLIEIRAPAFQPAAVGRGHDRRSLSLLVDAVETR
jgi:hypothetical protein